MKIKRKMLNSVLNFLYNLGIETLECQSKVSKQEYKRRDNSNQYSIYAWVEVGKQLYTWKDDPINRDIFFRYAHDTETFPAYLKKESGCMTVEQYINENYEIKIPVSEIKCVFSHRNEQCLKGRCPFYEKN